MALFGVIYLWCNMLCIMLYYRETQSYNTFKYIGELTFYYIQEEKKIQQQFKEQTPTTRAELISGR